MTDFEPSWKINMDYNEFIVLIKFLVKNSASAERESHYHELWSGVLNFLCMAFKKKQAMISCIPQYDIVSDRFRATDTGNDGNNNQRQRVTRSMRAAEANAAEHIELLVNERVAVDAGDTTVSSIDSEDVPATTWKRPDYFIIGRIFGLRGRGSRLSLELTMERPLLIFELKMDPNGMHVGDLRPGEKPDMKHVRSTVAKAVPQVLQQAQYLFSQFRDCADTVHAIIAVGTYCQDFSISRLRLPQGNLYDPSKYLPVARIRELAQYAENMTEPYHILNSDQTGLHENFLRAWSNARQVATAFKYYQRTK